MKGKEEMKARKKKKTIKERKKERIKPQKGKNDRWKEARKERKKKKASKQIIREMRIQTNKKAYILRDLNENRKKIIYKHKKQR